MNNSEKRLPIILIVEDVDWIRAAMKLEVERQGYRVAEARDDAEALAVAEQQPVTLILIEEEVPAFRALMDRRRDNSVLGQLPVAIVNPDAEAGAHYDEAYLLPDYVAIESFLVQHGGRRR
jgi:CheY-like chemotaxis protein